MKKPIKPLEELLDSVRDIEGFPIGKDEDILALSDPPYYTSCPNPYINDFIEEYGKPYDEDTDKYHREPFQGDLRDGRTDKIYNLHSYHTKVPPGAINRYVEHFTKSGDIVLDGFSGTGMTGVSCGMTNRNAILSDLSPIASFISYNNNIPIERNLFLSTIQKIIEQLKEECGWLYKTFIKLPNGNIVDAEINYVIWSEVYSCPYCNEEYVYWDKAVDDDKTKTLKVYHCSNCNAEINKNDSNKVLVSFYDESINKTISIPKQHPVRISCIHGKKKAIKNLSNEDFNLIDKINNSKIPFWHPINPILNKGEKWGDTWRAGVHQGLTHVHHFYTRRNLWVLSSFLNKIHKIKTGRLKQMALYFFTSLYSRSHKMNRYIPDHNRHVGPLSGTMYVSFLQVEISIFQVIKDKLKTFRKGINQIQSNSIIGTQSLTNLENIQPSSIDYIFTDPPFGDNLMYSELNNILESWLNISTNNADEAIINNSQNKGANTYKSLITACFKEYYRVLKPNRWITIVFHNSKSSIWNIIQDSIAKAGFVVSQVNILDKKKGTTKQLSYSKSTKNDLVISAYKPKQSFDKRFLELAGEGLEEDFIKMHLSHLKAEPTIERTEQMLYSKLLAYYVQRSYAVKYDASTFYKMLRSNFVEEDGYWFNKDQVVNYREYKQKMRLEEIDELKSGQLMMFIDCEKTAIIWLHTFLDTPKDFHAIHPAFTKIVNISDDSVPELMELLDKNFILANGKYRRPQTEDEKMSVTQKRERELQREFDILLLEAKGSRKKIKECRKQAVIYGFEQCYKNNRFQDILALAKRLDTKIIENDSEISEFIEVAELKVEGF